MWVLAVYSRVYLTRGIHKGAEVLSAAHVGTTSSLSYLIIKIKRKWEKNLQKFGSGTPEIVSRLEKRRNVTDICLMDRGYGYFAPS